MEERISDGGLSSAAGRRFGDQDKTYKSIDLTKYFDTVEVNISSDVSEWKEVKKELMRVRMRLVGASVFVHAFLKPKRELGRYEVEIAGIRKYFSSATTLDISLLMPIKAI